jgi:hypothetical protein
MAATKAEVLEMLEALQRLPRTSGPVELSHAYQRAVERWEGLPENSEGSDKSWVARSQRAWKRHFDAARAGTEE